MTTSAKAKPERGVIRGAHVLWLMLGFFALIITADATMIYNAISTFGGVDNTNAYRDGLAYNQRIARETTQALTGWQDEIEVLHAPPRLRVNLRDRSGAAVTGKRLVATVARPATNRFDLTLPLTELAAGSYEAALPAAHEGSFIVDISAFAAGSLAAEPVYQTRRRLWIKP